MPHKEYKCSWIHVKRCRKARKRLLKEFADKEKLFKFIRENEICYSSEVSKEFNLPNPIIWERAKVYSVRFFNLLFGLVVGVPLCKFESIPKSGRKRNQYINELFFYLNELIQPTSWHKSWQEQIRFSVSYGCRKLTVQDLLSWLEQSGISFEELRGISVAHHHPQVNKFIRLTEKLLEGCFLKV